jgi:hypothetical protein
MTSINIEPIIGIKIEMDREPCRCGATLALIGEGAAMHAASVRCINCKRHRGWLPTLAVEGLLETTALFGRPTTVIRSPPKFASHFANDATPSGASEASNLASPSTALEQNMSSTFDDLYGSKWFSANDLTAGETQRRKIGKAETVELRDKDGSTKKKLAVWFSGVDKALVLNQTNANRLAAAHGKNESKWVGTSVEIYVEDTTYGPGVRLRPLKAKPADPISSSKVSIIPDADLNDDIPDDL